jgi:ArsR family transcriptional regulator
MDFCETFKALGDPVRAEILKLLKESPRTVGELVDNFDVSQPAISHHLAVLKSVGLVTSKRDGRVVYYALNLKCVKAVCDFVHEYLADTPSDDI